MTTIKLRRGTAAEWTTANPILAAGEMGIETDTRKFKFGDGTTPWNILAYASAEGGGGGTGDGTILTSADGATTYSKLALGDTLSVIDTSTKELNGLTQTDGTLNSELEFTGGSGAYLKMNEKYSLSTADSWEFQIKYKHNGGGSFPTVFGYASGTDFKTPAFILEDGSLKLYLSSDGYSWNLNSNNSGLVPISGTIYYFKIGFTGSQYYIKYNTTGWSDNFTTQWTLNSTTKVYCSDYFMLMNLSLNSNYYNTGTMYLQDTALIINEAEVWRGVNTIPGPLTLNANLDDVTEQINILKGTKQDILVDGNGTKVVYNKVDINQGNAGIQGLNLYQNNGTITKDNNSNITFKRGACGYIYFPNKGANNNYELVLHCAYLDGHGSRRDSDIHGIRAVDTTTFPNQVERQGMIWVDVWSSPFRAIIINKDSEQPYGKNIPTVNYIKYTIIGTRIQQYYSTDGVDYTLVTYENNKDYVEISETSAYLNLCLANRNSSGEINDCWTNTTLYSDSYILDKTTNTYLMKQGTTNEGVAVATSNKYGLVLPDNSTIVSNNGVLSSITPNNMVTTDTQQSITNSKKFYESQWFYGGLYTREGITSFRGNENITLANLIKRVGAVYVGDNNYETVIDGSTKITLDATTLIHELDDSTEATIVDSSNVSTYATGLPFPSNRYIDLELGASGTQYTAPADGWYSLTKESTAVHQNITLESGGLRTTSVATGPGGWCSVFIPVRRGDKVTISYNMGGRTVYNRFVYAEGAQ